MTNGGRWHRDAWFGRPCGRGVALLVFVALFAPDGQAAIQAGTSERTAASSPAAHGDIVIRVRRITGSHVAALDIEHLSREVDRLWAAYGVRLEWRDGRDIVAPADAAHLVVVMQPSSEGSGELPRHALATFHRMRRVYSHDAPTGRPDAVIMVALDRARRLAADAPAPAVESSVRVLIARVVAHEIGHYLLESGEHTAYGLMRATSRLWRHQVRSRLRPRYRAGHAHAGPLGAADERRPARRTAVRQ